MTTVVVEAVVVEMKAAVVVVEADLDSDSVD